MYVIDFSNKEAWQVALWLIASVSGFGNFALNLKESAEKRSWFKFYLAVMWLVAFVLFAYRLGLSVVVRGA